MKHTRPIETSPSNTTSLISRPNYPLPLHRACTLQRPSTTAATMASASAFLSMRLPTPSPSPSASPPSFTLPMPRLARGGGVLVARASAAGPAGAPSPLFNPRGDPFLATLSAASPEQLAVATDGERHGEDHLPFLEIFQNAKLMASPAQVSCFITSVLKWAGYG
jgi:hypothetical protein